MVAYWLMKSELDVYPWSQLIEDEWTHWDGVRNYQARNMMRDELKCGDYVLFYHSNCKPPHIAGVAIVSREGYPDFTSWDSQSKYFDAKSTTENPRWFMVDIEPVLSLSEIVTLPQLREQPELEGMPLLQRGQRLSVQRVDESHMSCILEMAGHSLEDLNCFLHRLEPNRLNMQSEMS